MQIIFNKKRDYRNFKAKAKAAGLKRGRDWDGGWSPTDKLVPKANWDWNGSGWDSVRVIQPRWVVTVAQ